MRILLSLICMFYAFANDVDHVRKARLDQNESMAAGDVDRAASFWTEDITLRRGLGSAISGKEAYRTALLGSDILYVRTPDLIEVSPHWPLAFESGTWSAQRNGTLLMTGRYSAQWVKREGQWLIRSEIFVALMGCEEGRDFPAAN